MDLDRVAEVLIGIDEIRRKRNSRSLYPPEILIKAEIPRHRLVPFLDFRTDLDAGHSRPVQVRGLLAVQTAVKD